MTQASPSVGVDVERRQDAAVLTVTGLLNSATYRTLRNAVIDAALDQPRAVLVDVNGLSVPSASAWSVFTSARWHVMTWPDVPILLVCQQTAYRRSIAANGIARYVPMYWDRESALGAATERASDDRRRVRTRLPARTVSLALSRALIGQWLADSAQSRLIAVAGTIATILVGNVLKHTGSAPVLIVETQDDTVVVAVEDDSHVPACRLENESGGETLSGLSIVSALCRAWGSTPQSSGKTVWALIGRENQL
ncbi:MAG: STAS domain-containing protein [Actinomycetota bacterium]|uniref:Sulfate transporter n=1 Tax=Mycobacterium lentiflavum TaxID=141349 RepID=A0ABY3V2G2_MYCLN|nr:STAS domain-containing protein [Mycobacterium lentiflavum]MEE3064314.1 STAS domain-containing protein [Actinomycetota bacterium]ULP43692.1 sulfate transporter [Mycobacterium lentiflavum]